jgi:methylated-DNA-[protein]-cysteine S-methyltransferase
MNDTTKEKVYWSLIEYGNWKGYMAASTKGLCYVGTPNNPLEELKTWVKSRYSSCELIEDHIVLQSYKKELVEYLKGKRDSFSFPIDIKGTFFQQEIWTALNQIPYGETCTYSEIAELIQKPTAVRAVGAAIGSNPVLICIPCHRVIGKNGKLVGYRGGLEMKHHLLQLEKM